MLRWLGQEEYEALERRARTVKQQWIALLECMGFLGMGGDS